MGTKPKILITGAGGYIGSISTYLFLKNNFEVVAIDNFSRGYKTPLKLLQEKFPQKLRFYHADLRDDLTSLFKKEREINAVVHYAALCSPVESVKYPKQYYKNNVLGTRNLLLTMKKNSLTNLVFSSTYGVYGEPLYVPVDEKHPTDPQIPYGQTKLRAEEEIKKSGLNYLVFRYSTVCGAIADGFLGDAKKPCERLVQKAVMGALGLEPFFLTCPKVATPDGSPIRDFIDVLDLARAHILAVNYLASGGKSEIVNLGTGSGYSVLEVIGAVQKITDVKFPLNHGKVNPWEVVDITVSYEKAERLLGWRPQHSLEDSIKSLVRWYTKHPQGWPE